MEKGRRRPVPDKPNGGTEEGARRAGSPKLVRPGSAGDRAAGRRARPRSWVRAGAGLIEQRGEGGAGGKGRGSG